MRKTIFTYFTLLTLILIGGVIRFHQLANNPSSLSIDEVAMGYSAYSVLKTAHDENGVFMPVTFASTGDYKNPIVTYLLVPSIAIFGLNEFGIRFPTALIGTISILAIFLLAQVLYQDKRLSLICAALIAISPWHIHYSRIVSESLTGTFFLMVAVLFFFIFLKKSSIWYGILSAIFFIVTLYTYHSLRLFTPLFILALFIFNRRQLLLNKTKTYFCGGIFLLGLTTLGYLSIFSSVNTRASMVFLTQDIEYTRYVILDHLHRSDEIVITFFFWIKRFLNYFQPEFLFFSGLNLTTSGILGLGVLYLFTSPWLILGFIYLFKESIRWRNIIIAWILLGVLPASLTNNEQSEVRSLLIIPAVTLIIGLGLLYFITLIRRVRNLLLRNFIVFFYIVFILINLAQAFLIYAVHFPLQKGEAFMEGTKESVLYAIEHKDQYSEIIYDPYRGVEAPYIVNIPHAYILFYSKYDPVKFQQEVKNFPAKGAHFGKFTIRRIDWRVDRNEKGKMFIGSPWSLPAQDLKAAKILKEIYLKNGNLALLIVSLN